MTALDAGLHGPKLQTAVDAYGERLAEGEDVEAASRLYRALATARHHDLTVAELIEQRVDGLPETAPPGARADRIRVIAADVQVRLLDLAEFDAMLRGYAILLVKSKPQGAFQLFGLHLVEKAGLLAPVWRRDLEGARALEDRIHQAMRRLPHEGRPDASALVRLGTLARRLARTLARVVDADPTRDKGGS